MQSIFRGIFVFQWAILGIVFYSQPSIDAAQIESLETASAWPQWRGPAGTGVAESTADPPIRWSETENVKWKSSIPGLGHSSPVVFDDKIVVTTAIPIGERFAPIADNRPGSHDNLKVSQRHQYVVMAFRRDNGAMAWKTIVGENIPHEGGHNSASLASASPVADGVHVFASFGSQGVFCLDVDGKIVWSKQLGKMHSKHGHGEGSSPALFRDKLIVNWDHEGESFIVAFDKSTGNEVWRNSRNEVTSWSSPIVTNVDDEPQVIVAGTAKIRGYRLLDGKPIWQCGGLSNNVCATPVVANGILIAGSSYDVRAMMAIRLSGAKGDITGTRHVLWKTAQRTPYVPSPLLLEGKVYFLRHYQGILTQLDAESGDETIGPFRLTGIRNVYSSPVAAADRIYVTDRNGTTVVLSHSQMPKLLAVNRLDERISASHAILGNDMFIRGESSIYCLSRVK